MASTSTTGGGDGLFMLSPKAKAEGVFCEIEEKIKAAQVAWDGMFMGFFELGFLLRTAWVIRSFLLESKDGLVVLGVGGKRWSREPKKVEERRVLLVEAIIRLGFTSSLLLVCYSLPPLPYLQWF